MSERRIKCPKCDGSIIFPEELENQAIACPHCDDSIFIPKQKNNSVWWIFTAFLLIAICLASVLIWGGRGKSLENVQTVIVTNKIVEVSVAGQTNYSGNQEFLGPKQGDELVFELLSKEFYRCLNEGDVRALRLIMSESCQNALSDKQMEKTFKGGARYDFVAVGNVSYKKGANAMAALVRVKRVIDSSLGGRQEGVRELKFVKEANGWRLFRDFELAEAIVENFFDAGFGERVKSNVQVLRDNDPFAGWDRNDTNAFEAIYKFAEGGDEVFPWHINLTVKSNRVDGRFVHIDFDVRNSASIPWDSPLLEFQIRREGKVAASDNVFLPVIRSGRTVGETASFLLKDVLQSNANFELDAFYSIGGNKCQIVQGLPVQFSVVQVTNLVKFEVIRTSFDLARTVDDTSMWSARIDYKLINISSNSINDIQIKCVWSLLNGQVLDQSSDYVVGFGDVPLSQGQTKTGFMRCSKGYSHGKVPVKVDIYLESEDRRSLIKSGLLVK